MCGRQDNFGKKCPVNIVLKVVINRGSVTVNNGVIASELYLRAVDKVLICVCTHFLKKTLLFTKVMGEQNSKKV